MTQRADFVVSLVSYHGLSCRILPPAHAWHDLNWLDLTWYDAVRRNAHSNHNNNNNDEAKATHNYLTYISKPAMILSHKLYRLLLCERTWSATFISPLTPARRILFGLTTARHISAEEMLWRGLFLILFIYMWLNICNTSINKLHSICILLRLFS